MWHVVSFADIWSKTNPMMALDESEKKERKESANQDLYSSLINTVSHLFDPNKNQGIKTGWEVK